MNFVDGKKNILLFAGGEFGLGKNKTLETLETLVKYFDDIQIIAIAGRNEKMKAEFESIVNKYNKLKTVKVLEFTDKVPQFMSICDLVVTKPGGLTTSESLASNLPMVIINPIPGQEEENAEFLEANNVGIWIKKDMPSYNVFNDLFSSSDKLQNMKINTEILSKKHSTEDICKIIIN